MAKTFEEWRRLVGGTTVTKSPADADAIAAALVENPDSCVWHEHAKFYGNLDRCNCSTCHPAPLFTRRTP